MLIGLAALTRNEAAFVGFAWLLVVWAWPGVAGRRKVALIAAPAVVALAIFAPWMVRNWIEFGNPLPGQALSNALSVTGFDIFAWIGPADAVALPRGRPCAAPRDAGRWPRTTTCSRSC